MGKYLRKFETTAAYNAAKDGLIKPNVSYIVEGNDVEYNPIRSDIITYNASAKLPETTSTGYTAGLHTNAFSGASGQLTITSHTFENGVGIIEFNDDVTSIGNNAFYGCKGLISVTIGNGVTSIGVRAFSTCSGLTSIVVDSANNVYDSRNNCNAIINTSTNELIAGCKNTIIPNSVTSIGQNAFEGCSSLTNVTIPDSVTSIGYSAFGSCKGLTNVTIPDSVTSIDEYAFYNCTGLTSVTIGSGVTSIGQKAFYQCSGLISITSLAMTAPTIQSNTFWNVKTNGTLTVPSGSKGYDVWMYKYNYYLGYYSWSKVEQ